MSYNTLLLSLDSNILTVTVNRPDKLNALNNEVINELSRVMADVYHDSEIRSVIITGSGSKAFIAGADISQFEGLSVEQGMELARKGGEVFNKIERSPKPIVAAVNGFALGGGCELAMACHFRIASDNAKFGQPEVNLGLIPGYGGTQRLTQLIGKGRAMELLLSGNMIDADTALRYGLVNHVVPGSDLLGKCTEILTVINSKAPIAIEKSIAAANAVFNAGVDGFELEIQSFGECFGTEDMKEGTAAFLQKRKPVFKGQ